MKKFNILMINIFLLSVCVNAQDPKGKRLYSGNFQNLSYLIYPAETKIKAEVKSQKELDYKYPECLLLSIIACTDEVWEIKHTLGGKENADIKSTQHYGFIKSMNRERNYLELKHKFEFSIMGIPTAVIKFYLVTEQSPQPQAGVVTMQKIDGRWQKTSMKMFSKISMTALRLKSEALEKIIYQDQSDKFLRAIHQKVYDGQTLNFDKLAAEIDFWYMDETKYNQEIKNYFKDPNSLF